MHKSAIKHLAPVQVLLSDRNWAVGGPTASNEVVCIKLTCGIRLVSANSRHS